MPMNFQVLIGAALLAVAAGLIYVALLDGTTECPRLQRFSAMLFPPVFIIVLVQGLAALISGLFEIAQ